MCVDPVAAAAAVAVHGYVPLTEFLYETGAALYRAHKRCDQQAVIVLARWLRTSDTAHSAKSEYELLKRLHPHGVAPEPLAWFLEEEFDMLVIRDGPSERLVLGSEFIRKRAQGMALKEFFPIARALLPYSLRARLM